LRSIKISKNRRKTKKKEDIKIVDNFLADPDILKISTKITSAENDRI
jgi:hypothetical protein